MMTVPTFSRPLSFSRMFCVRGNRRVGTEATKAGRIFRRAP